VQTEISSDYLLATDSNVPFETRLGVLENKISSELKGVRRLGKKEKGDAPLFYNNRNHLYFYSVLENDSNTNTIPRSTFVTDVAWICIIDTGIMITKQPKDTY